MVRESFRSLVINIGSNRRRIRTLYYLWVAVPYPLRRVATAGFILCVLLVKKLARVDRQDAPTPTEKLGNLSFWGVPEIDVESYRLEITGAVEHPVSLTFQQIKSLPSVSRQVRQDCVGGFRNNWVMEGVALKTLLEQSGVRPEAQRVVFHCADGYDAALEIDELLASGAFLAYQMNGEEIPKFGYPLRLAAPGKYGYQWAKWVIRIELVTDRRRGHWVRLGLPDRGNLGDFW